jgi:glycosyltransferase involved in cell wall biosynthesis
MADLAAWGEADRYMVQQEGNLVCDPQDLILCSGAYIKIIRDTFMTDRPIHIIYNGINTDEWNPGAGDPDRARADHLLSDRPVALYVGRIATMKGIVHLLDALEAEDPGWTVVLAGEVNANTEKAREGWEVTKRIRALEAAHPERLRWVGFHHGQALRDLYAVADAVVMPSIHEPFGIVALEAMAMGTPLLATEVDGLGEIVCDGDGGEFALIIPPWSPVAILQGLRMMKDPEVRAKLTGLGLERVLDFTWEEASDRTVAVYRKALARAELAHQVRQGASLCPLS